MTGSFFFSSVDSRSRLPNTLVVKLNLVQSNGTIFDTLGRYIEYICTAIANIILDIIARICSRKSYRLYIHIGYVLLFFF